MNPIKSFDINRVGLLIKKELFYQRRAPWIIIGAVFSMLLLFHLMMASEGPGANDLPTNHVFFYILTLVVLGTIFTSSAFNELNNKSEAQHYLSIPASHLEKLLSKWLVTGVLYVFVFNIFYWLFTVISNILTGYFFEESAGLWNPFAACEQLKGMSPFFISKIYLATHVTYLAGAVYFRKFAYFKTMIAQTCISVVVIGLIGFIGYLFFHDVTTNGSFGIVKGEQNKAFIETAGTVLPVLGKILFWMVLPLWMLSYSYFRLKETEV